MNYYDLIKAKKQIEEHEDKALSVELYMAGDYSWTAVEVWSKEKNYIEDLDNNHVFGGLIGSRWATPMLKIAFEDGMEKHTACCISESEIEPELMKIKEDQRKACLEEARINLDDFLKDRGVKPL